MKLGTKTKAIKDFLTDDQILEVMCLFEHRKLDASRLFSSYMSPKWNLTVLESLKILTEIEKEL